MARIDYLPLRRTDVSLAQQVVAPHANTIALLVGSALFMQMLDATIVATALPQMAVSLREDPLSMSVVLTSYLVALTALIPVSGWLADRFSARTVFLGAVATFAVSSAICGLAPSLNSLVAARLVQGAAGALTAPIGRILILRSAPKSQLLKAMSYLAVPALVAPAMGPPIGGFIVVHASWRWIFLINLPIGAVALIVSALVLKPDRGDPSAPLDLRGLLLCTAALTALLFGLQDLSLITSSSVTAVPLLTIGLLCATAYVAHARNKPNAILDLSLLNISTYKISVIGGNLCRFSLGAFPFLLTLLLQIGWGLDPFHAGLIAFATALGSIAVRFIVSPAVRVFGFRYVLVGNSLLAGLLISSCTLFEKSPSRALVALLLFAIGFFRSLQLTVANTLGYADIPERSIARATSVASVAQYLAFTAGIPVSAFIVRLSATTAGVTQITTHDINIGIIAVGSLFAVSSLVFVHLPHHAGSELIDSNESVRGNLRDSHLTTRTPP